MPHDYQDDDEAGFGLREHIDEATSVNASAGYSIPSTPFIIAPYRSLAVFAKPGSSGTFSVSVTWDFDGLAGGADATEVKTSTLTDGETLIFRNQGVQVTDVTITGDANTAYVVMPSDVDPLASASAAVSELQYPMAEELLHFSSINRGSVAPEYTTNNMLANRVVDNTYVRGFYGDNNGVNGSDVFFPVRLGPHGSIWHLQFVYEVGPDFGIVKVEWGQFTFGEDASPTSGFTDPAGLLESVTLGPGMTFYTVTTNTMDCYAAVNAKNQITNTLSQFRIMGDVGDAVSANGSNDPDTGMQGLNGGPGVWYLHLKTNGKRAASAGFKLRFSSITLARESYWNFAVV